MNNKTETVTLNKIWSLRIDTILPIIAFSIPFLLSGPQLLTGTVVNTLLFIASTKQIKQKNLYLISLLYVSALIFTGIHLVPTIFTSSMGVTQLFTSLMGGTVAFVLFKIAKRKI